MLKLYFAIIVPILCYGCEIWGVIDNELGSAEMNYLKFILHLPSKASNVATCGEIGQLPLHRINICWHRLSPDNILALVKHAILQTCCSELYSSIVSSVLISYHLFAWFSKYYYICACCAMRYIFR